MSRPAVNCGKARAACFLAIGGIWLGCSGIAAELPVPEAGAPSSRVVLSADAALAIYTTQIKPLLHARCVTCHGPLQQQGGLRLDSVQGMQIGGESGPAVLPAWEASPLWQRISTDDPDHRMPPPEEGETLTKPQQSALADWLQAGTPAPAGELPDADPREHWAFRPITRPALPVESRVITSATGTPPAANPIDLFLAEKRQSVGVVPQSEASRDVLIRRIYLDLLGVPPDPQERDGLRADPSVDWYERAVDRLLADPRYGQRWGRHWMDVWRYSDWWGLDAQLRNSQPYIWHWRDWIVESLNQDVPYAEMIRCMLAADELYPEDMAKLRATGFLSRNYFLFNRNHWLDEVVEHVSKGFLGLTMNCAKCHDHKYDPIAQVDYYRVRAIFEPYHVRTDVLPGENDLQRDGISRVFDGLLQTPTYRFVRGQESQPDKSTVIPPGVPALFSAVKFEVQPVMLPKSAWQPERRTWVLQGCRDRASAKCEAARQACETLRTQQPRDDSSGAWHSQMHIAELAVNVAEAERQSVERRAAMYHTAWSYADHVDSLPSDSCNSEESPWDDECQADVQQAALLASRAERLAAVLAAQYDLALAEGELKRIASDSTMSPDQRAAAEKKVTTARQEWERRKQRGEITSDRVTPLTGAAWVPTRFLFSTQDDPTIPFPPTSTGRRTALARWIVDPHNPLTARVAVNHLWLRHFGSPLVDSPFDFGRKTPTPLQQPLIDWLACELRDHGWSMKHLHRLILTSNCYRQSSSVRGREANLQLDPDNHYWWRRTPQRLESQVIRDAMLAIGAAIDFAQGGPPIEPERQDQSGRRSLYFFHSHTSQNLFLKTFDEAMVKECYRREQSIVPQQALALVNSPLTHKMAAQIASQVTRTACSTADVPPDGELADKLFVAKAFEVVLGTSANEAELAVCLQALHAWRQTPGQEGDAVVSSRMQLVWALLNHNDFVTLR